MAETKTRWLVTKNVFLFIIFISRYAIALPWEKEMHLSFYDMYRYPQYLSLRAEFYEGSKEVYFLKKI